MVEEDKCDYTDCPQIILKKEIVHRLHWFTQITLKYNKEIVHRLHWFTQNTLKYNKEIKEIVHRLHWFTQITLKYKKKRLKRLSTDYTNLHRLFLNIIKRLSSDYSDLHRLLLMTIGFCTHSSFFGFLEWSDQWIFIEMELFSIITP